MNKAEQNDDIEWYKPLFVYLLSHVSLFNSYPDCMEDDDTVSTFDAHLIFATGVLLIDGYVERTETGVVLTKKGMNYHKQLVFVVNNIANETERETRDDTTY
ncbi:hypothetical protein GCM10023116_13410 [Kistimonas scapharcae]|uniref:Uncharacterized protein n=1 Tax=Kistimonas scapharcae TaxID=1036133 RepID=A0ABP8V2I2_9GAMM